MPADGHSGRFRLSTLQIIALLATGAALIAGVVLQLRTESAEISQPAAPVSQRANAAAPLVSESALPQDAALGRTKAMLEQQVVMADQTLCQYQYQTRYPNSSRPVSEHPDQVYPNQPVLERHAMRKAGGGTDSTIQMQSSQNRVYLAQNESAEFVLAAVSQSGQKLPLEAEKVISKGLVFGNTRPVADVVPEMQNTDGMLRIRLAPQQTGLATFHGTIRTELNYRVNGQAGRIFWDVIYSPQLPAQWAGTPADSLHEGALQFALKLNVSMPGRYVITARVDDARGTPLALLSFNDVLGQGLNTVSMPLAGNLIRDLSPVFPLRLRDIEGYLLKEDADPDRLLLPRLDGERLQTRSYALKAFSDQEWQSEERTRYLTEFRKDLMLAQGALQKAWPEVATKGMPRSDCSRQREVSAQVP